MTPRRLALAGQMGAGKSTVADLLVRRYGYVRLAFADMLRDMLHPAYGKIDKAETYGGMTGRELLQRSGAALRSVDEQVLIRAVLRQVTWLSHLPIVVDDVRMPAEAEALRKRGFTVVRLVCDEAIRRRRIGAAWSGEKDATEVGVFPAQEVATDGRTPEAVLAAIEEGANV